MGPFFLSIGSNIEPEKNIPAALKLLRRKFPSIRFSSIYETDPVGPAGSFQFWNLAAVIDANLDPKHLAEALRSIEEALGRRRDAKHKYAPRTLDIDILPQADYEKQAFIMIPLAEIARQNRDTKTGRTYGEIAEDLPKQGIKRIERKTQRKHKD